MRYTYTLHTHYIPLRYLPGWHHTATQHAPRFPAPMTQQSMFLIWRSAKCWGNPEISSGQNIATSAEVTPKCGLVREYPQIALNSGLPIIVICPNQFTLIIFHSVAKNLPGLVVQGLFSMENSDESSDERYSSYFCHEKNIVWLI